MCATKTDVYEEVIIAGFGGQGVILAGKLLAQAAMQSGLETTYMPSYGAEMRGGTANSMIVISDEPVASPIVTNPTSLIAMNKASVQKFSPRVKAGGLLIYNSSLADEPCEVDDSVDLVAVAADALAVEMGNIKIANMIMLGAYFERKGILDVERAAAALPGVLAKRYHKTLPINVKALQRGAQAAKESK